MVKSTKLHVTVESAHCQIIQTVAPKTSLDCELIHQKYKPRRKKESQSSAVLKQLGLSSTKTIYPFPETTQRNTTLLNNIYFEQIQQLSVNIVDSHFMAARLTKYTDDWAGTAMSSVAPPSPVVCCGGLLCCSEAGKQPDGHNETTYDFAHNICVASASLCSQEGSIAATTQ